MGRTTSQLSSSFYFLLTSDLNAPVELRVDGLFGTLPSYQAALESGQDAVRPSAVSIRAELTTYGERIGTVLGTPYVDAGFGGCNWDGLKLVFPVQYRDLSHRTQLSVSLWELREGWSGARLLGSSTMRLFSFKGRLRTGSQTLQLWPGCPPDTSWPSATPARCPPSHFRGAARVESVLARFKRGEVPRVPWLDALALRTAAQLRARLASDPAPDEELAEGAEEGVVEDVVAGIPDEDVASGAASQSKTDAPRRPPPLFLRLSLARFPSPVLFHPRLSPPAPGSHHPTSGGVLAPLLGPAAQLAPAGSHALPRASAGTLDALCTPLRGLEGGNGAPCAAARACEGKDRDPKHVRPGLAGTASNRDGSSACPADDAPSAAESSPPQQAPWSPLRLWSAPPPHPSSLLFHDGECGRDNPSELKAAKLARNARRGPGDREARPRAEERAALEAAASAPPGAPPSPAERALLWRYRYALRPDPRALPRVLASADWGDAAEAAEAAALLEEWAPLHVSQALALLSQDFADERVRWHAVKTLEATPDRELELFLVPLVAAARYDASETCALSSFLATRVARREAALAVPLFWTLCVELEDPAFGRRAAAMQAALLAAAGEGVQETLSSQLDLVARLRHLAEAVRGARGSAARKTGVLRGLLSPAGALADLGQLRCWSPLDPGRRLLGLEAQQCAVFKSALCPLKLVFRAEEAGGGREQAAQASLALDTVLEEEEEEEGFGEEEERADRRRNRRREEQEGLAEGVLVGRDGEMLGMEDLGLEASRRSQAASPFARAPPERAASASSPPSSSPPRSAPVPRADLVSFMYKKGDDLRQDQLAVQLIRLMDQLLLREHLDLRVTAYKVLPTSVSDGLIEFVPSLPLARLLAQHRTIHHFLALHHPDERGPFGLRAAVLENFIRSCAAACVMTYLLGVGDRHLDNLMLTPDGCLFHIDFGYMFGRDPKPFPPPMKLCREMVDAMGGPGAPHYAAFTTFCTEAYNLLRKSSGLLLGLVHLMAGANVPDIAPDPAGALLRMREKLRIDLRDEEAAAHMRQLLADSAGALLPQIMETTHRWAQYWR